MENVDGWASAQSFNKPYPSYIKGLNGVGGAGVPLMVDG